MHAYWTWWFVAAVLIGGGITCGAVNPDRALRRAGRF